MKSKSKLAKKRRRFVILMLLPSIIFPLIFTYYPMVCGSMMAFQNYNLMNLKNVQWIGLDNFKNMLKPSIANSFPLTVMNTVKWVVISLFFQFTIGFAMALLLKKKFKGSNIYQGLIFFPWAVSGFIIGIMWRWMYNGTSGVFNDILVNKLHILSQPVGWLADKHIALYACSIADIWYGIPYFTIMITAALRGVSEDLYGAASVDGANALQKFIHITVPSIKSVLLLTVLLRVIWIFNFPDLIYSLPQGGPAGSSNIITSYMMQLVQSLDYGTASAVGVLCILFLVIFAGIYLAVTKYTEEN